MNRHRSHIIILCSILTLCSAAHAVKFEYRVRPGDQWRQKLRMKGSGVAESQGMTIELAMETTSAIATRVNTVKPDGSFTSTMDYRMESMRRIVNGMLLPDKLSPPTKWRVNTNKLGVPLRVEAMGGGSKTGDFDFGQLLSVAQIWFPDHELNVGDTWDASPDPEVLPMQVTYKLLGIKKVGRRDVAEIEYRMKVSAEAFGKIMREVTGMDVEVTGPGMLGVSTGTVEVATGLPGLHKGLVEVDLTIKHEGGEIRQAMKLEVVTETSR